VFEWIFLNLPLRVGTFVAPLRVASARLLATSKGWQIRRQRSYPEGYERRAVRNTENRIAR
jgi:hypothetical protein